MTEGQAVSSEATKRASIGFLPKVATDLETMVEQTGHTRADIVNRAITLYAFITRHIDNGDDVLIRDVETREIERIRLL